MDDYFNNNGFHNNDDNLNNSCEMVHRMSHGDFRQKLINHFDIVFQKNNIHWPTRNGLEVPDI
jgi:hypothetical protein